MVATHCPSRRLPPLPKPRCEAKRISQERTQDSQQTSRAQPHTNRSNTATPKATKQAPSTAKCSGHDSSPLVSDDGGGGADRLQRKESTGTHFLRGIQLDSCADILSIPDPPSPGKLPARRYSSSAAVRPLRDISNDSDAENDGDSNVTSRRKKRKSTTNLQSSLSSAGTVLADTYATPQPETETVAFLTEPDGLQSSSKRRKKRQSIVLPSDLEPTEANNEDDEYTKTFASFKNNPSPPATPARETKTPCKIPTTTLCDIRRIVHEYTLLPKENRLGSASEKELMRCTGYSLRSGLPHDSNAFDLSAAPADLPREKKLEFIMALGPQLKEMDACKVSDAKMVAEVTQCKPEKLSGGFYRYVHSVTGRPVSPEEFEDRYLMMLEEVNQIRSQGWKDYFCQLRDGLYVEEDENDDDGIPESNGTQDVEEDEEDETKMPAVVASNAMSQSQGVDYSNDNVVDEEGSLSQKPDEEALLPFPSREKVSSNPVIARAERKLWNAIDKALAEYSREVLEAQAAAPQTPVHC